MTAATDKITGAILGALIGEALGVGPHWYYNLGELHQAYGPWIDDYTEPKPGRYHAGLKAGQSSQAGILLGQLMESIVKNRGYDEESYCQDLDSFLQQLDGTPRNGPGGYTSQSIRELYQKRVLEGKGWQETGGPADTTEAIERTIPLVARYYAKPKELAQHVLSNTRLTQSDQAVQAMTLAYCLVLADLIAGRVLDGSISQRLMALSKEQALPFHTITHSNFVPPAVGELVRRKSDQLSSPDALINPSYVARAAVDPGIIIEPAWKIATVYGLPCAIYQVLPATYYLAARFPGDFESAVLNALNGGGQNQARAMLTGALVGAMVGVSNIPQRFIEGLENSARWIELAKQLAADA